MTRTRAEIQAHNVELLNNLNDVVASRTRKESEVSGYRTALKNSEQELKYITEYEVGIRTEIHKLQGEAKNCDHVFQSEPSSRGVGFDSVCKKCKWPENYRPVY